VSNDSAKIRIGSFDYPLPFLSNLIDSLRDEPQSFTGNLLRMWQDSELARLQEIERNTELETRQRQELDEQQKIINGDD
jgi:hypothetical protein